MAEYEIVKAENIADKEEITKQFSALAKDYYDSFASDREQYEDIWQVVDYMKKAANNRTIESTERSKGMNIDDDNRAQTGSTLFYRYVNQFSSLGYSIQSSAEEPFFYKPIVNHDIRFSPNEAKQIANQSQLLSKWIRQTDKFEQKSIEFWDQLATYGNVPVMIHQEYEEATRKVRTPVYETFEDPETGNISNIVKEYKEEEQTYIVKNYPSLTILSNDSLYVDPYIGNIQDQNCVVITSVRSKGDINRDVKSGNFSEDQFEKLTPTQLWDGNAGSEFRRKKIENQNLEFNPSESENQYLQWDVFMQAPIDGGTWKEDEIPMLYWGTFLGNTLDEAVCMRLMRNPDPDDEIPIQMVHVNPDSSNMIYHLSPAEIIRSNYSTECTLKNLALDNMGLVCNPPLMAIEGAHHITDFTYKKGQLWNVLSQDAITEFQTRDITQNVNALLDYTKSDSYTALNLDKVFMGEGQGARTSASEAISINKNSMQPHLVQTKYILEQFLGFYARKSIRYMTYFAHPEQIVMITDEPPYERIQPSELFGDFDVVISIVDDYENDLVKQQFINEAIRIIASSPALMESQTHKIDVGELLKEWFRFAKFDASKIIQPLNNADAVYVARNENIAMIQNGQYIEPKEGENKPVHLAEHKAEALRYQGLEERYPGLQLLTQHIAATEFSMNNKGVNNLPAGPQNQTNGEVVGNQMAGALAGGMA